MLELAKYTQIIVLLHVHDGLIWVLCRCLIHDFSDQVDIGFLIIFSFIVYGLMPLLRLIPKHFGKDLSITLLPVLMLGVLYSLSRLVVEWIPDSGWPLPSPLELNDQSLWKVMGQFIVHLTHPIADMVITLKEFAVDKWFVPLLFVAATLVIGWRQSIHGKVDESSRKKS